MSRAGLAGGGAPGLKGSALIVGAGIMGLCTAWALRRDGWQVRVLEQDSVPNPRGSSVDRSRLIRHAYGDARGYMRMVDDAFDAWDLLWADLDETLYVNTGVVVFSSERSGWVADSLAALQHESRDVTVLSPDMIAAHYPMLSLPRISTAFRLPRGGILRAEPIVAALARRLGDAIVQRRVTEVLPDRAAVRCADGNMESADLLVVAAGPWGPRLLPALALRVTPSRQVVGYYQPPPALAAAWARAPALIDISKENGFWAFPPVADAGVKVGDHSFSLTGDPDGPRTATPEDIAVMEDISGRHLRDFGDYRLIEAKVCYYDVEPAEEFLLEPIGPRSWVMSGFSGHGFKFAACLGLAMAKAAGDELAAVDLPGWAAGRASTVTIA